ncbi:lipocalin-like domain-containing protein [Streptomyces sp. NPDC096040]|uniref:lipocalin-like domain-containing protein n=1 Tax=Streptomyces sp. NPDC096040 TaxID=3155541 RepID=UPI00332CAB49
MEDIVGTWVLEDFTVEREGVTSHPLGEHPGGVLLYTPDGWMSALLTADPGGARASGLPEIGSGTVAYAGPWELTPDGAVLHHVQVSHYGDWLGTVLERSVRFTREGLELTAVATGGTRGVLRWRRPVA